MWVSEFIPDTDAQLRSLLVACQAADAPLPALARLADWLDERGDPRGRAVRIQSRYWYVYYCREGFDRHYAAEADELQRRSDEVTRPVYDRWLGFRGDGASVIPACQTPLLDLQVTDVERVRPHLPRLRAAFQAGWVWDMYCLGWAVDEMMSELLTGAGPVRRVGFAKDAAKALRAADLAALRAVPHLRELYLPGPRVPPGRRTRG